MTLIEKALPPLTALRNLLNAGASVLDLGIRLYISKVFFLSGLTKIRDWETTITLFQEEYHVPVLPPELAAVMGTAGELCLPVLLTLGLATRFAAFGLTFVNIMAVVSYWHFLKDAEPALAQHIYWGVLILVVLLHGPGKVSLDALIWRKLAGPDARVRTF
ncbi:MAG TPA: DoxX family protein [Burkholderiales bacterium]|nr:DoxX family protein [Burkholderiales bacterium]